MKKWLKRTIIITASVIGVVGVSAGGFYLGLKIAKDTRKNVDPEIIPVEDDQRLVFAKDRSLYDKNGNILRLRGVNAGNISVTEGWMAPYSCGPLYNDDGSIKTDKDGNVEYPELTQEEVYAALKNNTNLSDAQREELTDVWRYNWFSAQDFVRIKNDYHMNTIRLPIYWRDIMDEDNGVYTLKSEEEAFGYLDWFMENCRINDLYCILDLHGAVKTQNGYEHSGSTSTDMLWDDEEAIQLTCDIWEYIANHYKDSVLGETIATYDILNEPCGNYQGETNSKCYPVFDRLYKAIRNTGDEHVITIPGCWTYANFVSPSRYGWENIQYEVHLYNWPWLNLSYDTYFNGLEATRIGHDYNVPYFVGEFTFFHDDYSVWEKWLGYFDRLGYSWTIWNYKKTVVGWWNDNWGMVNYRLHLNNKTHEQKVDLRTADYGKLKEVFECSNTTNCYESIAARNLAQYLSEH